MRKKETRERQGCGGNRTGGKGEEIRGVEHQGGKRGEGRR